MGFGSTYHPGSTGASPAPYEKAQVSCKLPTALTVGRALQSGDVQSKEEVDADTSGDEAEEEPHGHKVHWVWK